MSRSNPDITNPAQHFFQWSGSRGDLTWWNKDEKKAVPVRIPFTFMVLDELATITGYNDQDQSGYWSNEVRSVAREEFTVKTSKGTKQVGLYKDLADARAKGAKYAKSIYIAHKGPDGEYIIGNLKASGACLTAWIEFSQEHKVQNGTVMLTGGVEAKKGATVYQVPIFEYRACTPEEFDIAIELDKELQIYLSQYLAANAVDRDTAVNDINDIDQSIGVATDEQITEYRELKEKRKLAHDDQDEDVETYKRVASSEPMPDFPGDEPIDLSDIPF